MARHKRPGPTDRELAILSVLWQRGPSTVREVHEALRDNRETGYTTTLKLMQIMAEKGLVDRDTSSRTHVYRASVSREHAQRQLVRNLAQRAFDGSTKSLVMQALSARKTSPQDLAEIRRLLDELEGGRS